MSHEESWLVLKLSFFQNDSAVRASLGKCFFQNWGKAKESKPSPSCIWSGVQGNQVGEHFRTVAPQGTNGGARYSLPKGRYEVAGGSHAVEISKHKTAYYRYYRWLIVWQGLVTVCNCPILGILDITAKSSHLVDHIPFMVGWCSMGTCNARPRLPSAAAMCCWISWKLL